MWKNKNIIIVENWKMNPPELEKALSIFDFTTEEAKDNNKAKIIICPPFMYLNEISERISEKKGNENNIKIGAQNCFWEKEGAYTGEISPVMLYNMNCEYVILGHSERREYLNENDETINKKIKAALNAELKVIFCIGEKERDENKNYLNFLSEQIEKGLYGILAQELENIIVAYEPRWAISAAKNAKADDPNNLPPILDLIKKTILNLSGNNFALSEEIPILYGGSIDSANFKEFLKINGLAGFLIGGASLKPNEIKEILCLI